MIEVESGEVFFIFFFFFDFARPVSLVIDKRNENKKKAKTELKTLLLNFCDGERGKKRKREGGGGRLRLRSTFFLSLRALAPLSLFPLSLSPLQSAVRRKKLRVRLSLSPSKRACALSRGTQRPCSLDEAERGRRRPAGGRMRRRRRREMPAAAAATLTASAAVLVSVLAACAVGFIPRVEVRPCKEAAFFCIFPRNEAFSFHPRDESETTSDIEPESETHRFFELDVFFLFSLLSKRNELSSSHLTSHPDFPPSLYPSSSSSPP